MSKSDITSTIIWDSFCLIVKITSHTSYMQIYIIAFSYIYDVGDNTNSINNNYFVIHIDTSSYSYRCLFF